MEPDLTQPDDGGVEQHDTTCEYLTHHRDCTCAPKDEPEPQPQDG